jgi:hypothetical protein
MIATSRHGMATPMTMPVIIMPGRRRWAQQGSNLRPLACKASALPLSYAPDATREPGGTVFRLAA